MESIVWDILFNWVAPAGIGAMFVALVFGLIWSAPWWSWMNK